MPGPPPDPNSARSKKRGLSVLPSVPVTSVPEPPRGLSKATNEDWTAFWTSPFASLVTPAQYGSVRRLFELRDTRDKYRREGMKRPVVLGSTGQQVINPLLAQVDKLESQIVALEDRFGLSPMAAMKLQVKFGDASKSIADTNARLAAGELEPVEEEADPRRLAQ